jgi:uncharacterized membrane protein YdjX (TVP38/TMEM64 family)
MRSRNALKAAVLLVLVAGVAAIYFSPARTYLTRAHIAQVVASLRAVWYGPLLLVAAYAIGSTLIMPASIFVISAGVIWGWKFGAAYAMAGAMLGATASYFAGRFLGEGLLEKFGRAGELVSRQVSNAGFVSMLIARLIPGPPFAMWNYGAGIARMPFGEYFFATFLGILPPHIIFAYCADSLFRGTMTEGDAFRQLAIVAGLFISLILATTLLKRRFAPTSAK